VITALLIFILAAGIAFAAGCFFIERFVPSPRQTRAKEREREPEPPIGDFLSDPAAYAEASTRRLELVRAYARRQLARDQDAAFRQHLLPVPGVAAEVEVQRVLNAVTDTTYDKLRVHPADRLDRIRKLWRWLTLPKLAQPLESAGGPCLMLGPTTETDVVELQGLVTGLDGERAQLDIGMHHGLGVGDLVQFAGETNTDWIGVGTIESANDSGATALWMGDQPPQIGDRAIVRFSGDSI
jgi:hypothetical protein